MRFYILLYVKIFISSCYKEMTKMGSSCLKLGLQCFTTIPQTFFAFDNVLITGEFETLGCHF